VRSAAQHHQRHPRLSKIEAGKLEIESIDFDIRETTAEVAELLAARAHAKGLELALRIEDAVPQRVLGDPGRIRAHQSDWQRSQVHAGKVEISVRAEPSG
jgi:hypothetical protein